MKWLFRAILTILAAFILCCIVGYFLPSSQIVETHVSVESYPDEIYSELSDLRGYPAWFHGFETVDEGQIIFAGAERGIGQSAAWREGDDNVQFGKLEIMQVETDNFVTILYEQGPRTISITYAVQSDVEAAAGQDSETVLLLARYETPLGGFPYLSRLRGKLAAGGIASDLDSSLLKLKSLMDVTTTP